KRYKDEAKRRFENEAKIMEQLNHPNIVRFHNYHKIDATAYLVLHYVEGENLAEYLKSVGQLSIQDAYTILADIISAVDYIHQEKIIHRDLKPSNVLIRKVDEKALVLDFGLATHLGMTEANLGIIGTIAYMSPEQIQDGQSIDHRADIYALGVIAYQILTGHLPYDGNTGHILFGHLNQPPPDPQAVMPTIPLTTANAIQRAMAKNPDDR